MPIPWPENLIADALPYALITGVAAGLIGAFLAGALSAAGSSSRAADAGMRMPSVAPAAIGLVAIAAIVALNVGDKPIEGVRGELTLATATPGKERTVDATVRIDPAMAIDDRALGQRDRVAGRPEARPRRARGGLARRLSHVRAAAARTAPGRR